MIDGGAEFAALRLANEGGTHGPVSAYVVTGWPSTYPYERRISRKPYRALRRGGESSGADDY